MPMCRNGLSRTELGIWQRCNLESGLPAIAALPALIIWGDGDFAFGDRELWQWEQTLTSHQTVIVKGAGHFVPSDAPEQFAAAIRDWHPGA